MSKPIFLAMLVLALTTLACGFNIDLPSPATPGPDIKDEISVNIPDGKSASLTLIFGAGTLHLAPGAATKLVNGTAIYNIPAFKPEIKTEGSDVTIKQGDDAMSGFPNLGEPKNEWDFKIGSTPLALTINAGAYEGELDLGGLSLTSLSINDGAADVRVDFSSPNKEKMSSLTYETGASNVTLKNLANTNASAIVFESGMGNYTLDLSGSLQRDASLTVNSGMSNLTLVIPEGVAATVKVDSGLSNVEFPAGWSQHGDQYTQEGPGPAWTIIVDMGLGNLQVTH